jgi:hypothetical protein
MAPREPRPTVMGVIRKGLVIEVSEWPYVFIPDFPRNGPGRLGEASLPE